MSPSAPDSSTITKATVRAAARRAFLGEVGDTPDPACPGLMLRMRGKKVSWSYRGKLGRKQKRWSLGGENVDPQTARDRCWQVKTCLKRRIDPSQMVTAWLTGISIARQQRTSDENSIPWAKGRDMFLDDAFETKSVDTYNDYKKKLKNEPELKRFEGVSVSMITAADIETVLAAVSKRTESGAEGLQRTLSSMWTFLARPGNRERTGVVPRIIREARPPDRRRERVEDAGYERKEDVGPPDRIHIGRAIAIAKLGVFTPHQSAAVLLLCGTSQRRRTVVGVRSGDLQSFGDEVLWAIPPYFRKPAKKKRSQRRHLVPIVGFAAEAAMALWNASPDGGDAWLLPAAKVRKRGVAPRTPYMTPRSLSRVFEMMPGVDLSGHDLRYALATYGPQDLGWHADDAAIILDHLEGFDPGNVTAQHYNMDPAMVKKRRMMTQWIEWLEAQEAAAIEADPMLKDRNAIAKLVAAKRREKNRAAVPERSNGGKPAVVAA
jgi:integrase